MDDLMEVDILTDDDGFDLEVGTEVFADGGNVQGRITCLYADGTVDIHHADSHQGPVIDTFSVIHNDVRSFEEL